MSKQVRWQIPFVSIGGTHYRIDIYDEGTFTPVQLTAGPTPFTTDEDASDDYFHPVRSQSGTLQICTIIPDTDNQYITLSDLLPANNIDRPVRLINIDNSNAIEWQGFLSCEAYSQNYIGVPQILDIPLISVLEAMDSVPIYQNMGIYHWNILLYNVLTKISADCGLNMFEYIAYSGASWRILTRYIQSSIFYETKELVNNRRIEYTTEAISCKELLVRICTFMGWVCREHGTTVYLQRIGEEIGMYKQSVNSLIASNWQSLRTKEDLLPIEMAELQWMGDSHKRDIMQGAKSVEVEAKLKDLDYDLKLPDFPGVDVTDAYTKRVEDYNDNKPRNQYVENVLEQDDTAISTCDFHYCYGSFSDDGETERVHYHGACTQQDFLDNGFLRTNNPFDLTGDNIMHYAGAAFIRYAIKNDINDGYLSYNSGLYCVFLQWPLAYDSNVAPIFRIKRPNDSHLTTGKLHIKSEMIFFGVSANLLWLSYSAMITTKLTDKPMIEGTWFIVKLRVGGKWWNGSAWTSTEVPFNIYVDGTGFDVDIPITENMSGDMQFSLMPFCRSEKLGHGDQSCIFEAIFKSLEITYIPNNDISSLDYKENNYLRTLHTYYRDVIKVDTDLATNNRNIISPSLVIEDKNATGPERYTTTIRYNITATATQFRRPEVDLLNRLAAYYGAARQRLELEVAHPTAAPLPLLKLNGINDGKVYLPLSESRDWQTGVCKLTCFETPI